MPSLTIDVDLRRQRWRDRDREVAPAMLPPAGTVSPVHVTLPVGSVPPSSADTKVVLSGTGSVMVTPVAAALPMFFTVIV